MPDFQSKQPLHRPLIGNNYAYIRFFEKPHTAFARQFAHRAPGFPHPFGANTIYVLPHCVGYQPSFGYLRSKVDGMVGRERSINEFQRLNVAHPNLMVDLMKKLHLF